MRWQQTSISPPPGARWVLSGGPSPLQDCQAGPPPRHREFQELLWSVGMIILSVYLRGFYEHNVASLWVSPPYSQESVHFTHGKVEVHGLEQLFLMLYSISCEKVHEVPISWCLCCCGSAEIQKTEHYNTKNQLYSQLRHNHFVKISPAMWHCLFLIVINLKLQPI